MDGIPLGIQLFTVREQLTEDFRGTLSVLAGMGYRGVELGGNFGDMSPDELAGFLQSLGLTTCGLHSSVEALQDPGSAPYEYAAALGSKHVTTGLLSEVERDWAAAIENVARAAKVAAEKGFTFTYHNHAQEMATVDGGVAIDVLAARTDPDTVQFELDTYWVKKGGYDPVAYIRKYAGRLPQLHLKDMDPSDGSFTELGEGLMDLAAIFAAARDAGVQWMIYEQDRWKRPALESCRMSIENLKNGGFI
ncbi:MAG: sugar phosphate isomerase/epimerase family protein [Planctomycetota bacterium]|jgi:sugar phosphate isomerase/epimerase